MKLYINSDEGRLAALESNCGYMLDLFFDAYVEDEFEDQEQILLPSDEDQVAFLTKLFHVFKEDDRRTVATMVCIEAAYHAVRRDHKALAECVAFLGKWVEDNKQESDCMEVGHV